MNKIRNFLIPLRLDHWVKNLVIIFGFIFATFYKKINIGDLNYLFFGFFVLCISASSNYLINEYCDKDFDKNHPVKRWRYFVKNYESLKIIIIKYFFLTTLSVSLSILINKEFFIINLIFIFCAILYNVKPFRFKDIYLIDVLIESINNPIRFLLGWVLILPEAYPPISVVLFFWFVGCFLMSMKRYSEYKFIIEKKAIPTKYRLSFNKYNKDNLYSLSFFYCLLSFFFFTIFFIKYKIEFILLVPIVCYLYIHIFKASEKKNSLIMKIEKIYKDKLFVFLIILISIMVMILLNIEIKILDLFEQKELIYFK